MNTPDYTSQRVRHTLRMRLLTVLRTERVAADIVRITLGGDELEGFVSASFDDHVKVFLPRDGETAPLVPNVADVGKRTDDDSKRPVARDYTPRRYDPLKQELDIEFVLHGDGPGSNWAARAKPGDPVGIGGPRGSFVISSDFDWYLLAGDETAVPAIGRRIEELPDDRTAIVIVEAASPAALPRWPARPNVHVRAVYRNDATENTEAGTGTVLLDAVRAVVLPEGVGHAWVAAESKVAKSIRTHLVEERGVDKQHIRASSYWRHGAVAHHESIDD